MFATTAHTGSNMRGPHGGITSARVGHFSQGHPTFGVAPGQSGQGDAYQASAIDAHQPWPEAEMRRFQKPRWEPYQGK